VRQAYIHILGYKRGKLQDLKQAMHLPESWSSYLDGEKGMLDLAKAIECQMWARWIVAQGIGQEQVKVGQFIPLPYVRRAGDAVEQRLHELQVMDKGSRVPKMMRSQDFIKYNVGKNREAAAQGLKAHAFFTTAKQSATLHQWAEGTIAQANIFHDFILQEVIPSCKPSAPMAGSRTIA
jgi:hypothetical protein